MEVKDGSLTLGVRSLGGPLAKDWVTFGRTKLIYWGEAAEATDGLDAVLAGQVARANTILNAPFDSGENYKIYPNFSQELRDQLAAAVAAVETTTENEAKYKLVETFAGLYTAIRDCQNAYIHMASEADAFDAIFADALNAGTMTFEEYQANEAKVTAVFDAFENGTYSTEEALNVKFYEGEMDGEYYVLKTTYDIVMFAGMVNAGKTVKVKLGADIDLSDAPTLMVATNQSAPFQGEFDGQGHTINLGINVPNTGNYSGAFIRFATNATVKNLNLTGSVTTAGKHCASVISYAWGNVTVENVTSCTDNYTNGGDACLAGLVGMAGENGTGAAETNVTFRNCGFTGSMNHTGNPGDNHGGCFIGWKGNNKSTVFIYNSYAAPHGDIANIGNVNSFIRTWGGNDNGQETVENSYFIAEVNFGSTFGEGCGRVYAVQCVPVFHRAELRLRECREYL